VIANALERLRATGLVRDEGFAHAWVENRGEFRPRSRKMLAYELRQKGVAEDTIQQALANASEDDDLAYQAAIRYARKLVGTEWDEFRRRLLSFLARRGFSYSTAAPVIHQVWQELRSEAGGVRISDDEDS
jgi:regulatory protein